MVKLNVIRKVGKVIINLGIQEFEDMNFARQLVEKGLAVLVEGEIPEKKNREIKKEIKEVKKQEKEEKTPKNKKKG